MKQDSAESKLVAYLRQAMRDVDCRTQTDLAQRSGVTQQTVSKTFKEHTVPGPNTCLKLAMGLEIDPRPLLRLAGHTLPDEAVTAFIDEPQLQAHPLLKQAYRDALRLPVDDQQLVAVTLRAMINHLQKK